MWLTSSWSSTCGFSTSGMTMCLPFIMMPSITAMSSLNDQYALLSWCRWSLLSGKPAIIPTFSHCKCLSCAVACCIWWTNMHPGTFIDVCIASILMSMPHTASSLFSLWFGWNSQSDKMLSGPSLHSILTLYWCILRRMGWILLWQGQYNFLKYCYQGFMIHYYTNLPSKTIMVKHFETMQYPQHLSFNVAIPMLYTGQACTCKCNGPENGVVWSNIFWACSTISGL